MNFNFKLYTSEELAFITGTLMYSIRDDFGRVYDCIGFIQALLKEIIKRNDNTDLVEKAKKDLEFCRDDNLPYEDGRNFRDYCGLYSYESNNVDKKIVNLVNVLTSSHMNYLCDN